MTARPPFDQLPFRKGDPPYSAWGLWGLEDELGTLNFLTDEVVAKAAREEIQSGKRIALDWPLDKLQPPAFGRQKFHQQLVRKSPRTVNDDIITFNTQSSSQWDGLRHFGYQKEQLFYNGRTMDDYHREGATNVNGVQVMAQHGGIMGRGVLLDHVAYCAKHNVSYGPLAGDSISLAALLAVAKDQGTEFHPGDVLFIRSGFTAAYESMAAEERVQLTKVNPPTLSGVQTGPEVAKWVWERQFAAVAGDAPSWEAWPVKTTPALHEIFLAGWGCPIGELFDLEALAAHCQKIGRWSFFLTSVPLMNPGGAASPPNAVAVF